MQLSFNLGLRVQEITLLRIREVAELGSQYPAGYHIKEVLVLPKSFTKGARALTATRHRATERTSVRFTITEFDRLVKRIAKAEKTGQPVVPADYYSELKKSGDKTRELPVADHGLINAITRYLNYRSALSKPLTPNAPLLLSQKGGPYSPNTLQDHIAMMLRAWTGIERATSHSGRRTLATKLLHEQGEHLKTVQQVLGHKDAATTTIYQDLPEGEIRKTLKKAGLSYDK